MRDVLEIRQSPQDSPIILVRCSTRLCKSGQVFHTSGVPQINLVRCSTQETPLFPLMASVWMKTSYFLNKAVTLFNFNFCMKKEIQPLICSLVTTIVIIFL